MKCGKVWLVGAGPGDIGLFTLKGMEVLQKADVVVYDSLVGQSVLSLVSQEAQCINVGKRAGRHTMKQEEINRILLREAQQGKRVVRLKGGDPFLFGRGGEELELLSEYNIPYEVIPGVTSPISVPAYHGIPVTHRDFSSSLHIVTGHKKAGEAYDIDFQALVRTKGTLVFLMGVSALEDICNGLLEAGMDRDMPAAILQKGTTAEQKRIVATVSTLKAEAMRQGIEPPAIIVVGKVCSLAERFGWYEKLPLAGCKVLITRPWQHISQIAALLREKGAEVLKLPSIGTQPVEDDEALREAMERLSEYQWIVFTSPIGVEVFFEKLLERERDIRSLGSVKIAAVGSGTAKKLREKGLLADMVPSVYDGETLGKELAEQLTGKEKILIPRAEEGNAALTEQLTRAGAQVFDVPTYRTVYEESRLIDVKKEFEEGNISCAVFTSASTVKGFVEATKGLDYTKIKAACIGMRTREAADAWGMQTYVAEKATIDSLVDLVEIMYAKEEG